MLPQPLLDFSHPSGALRLLLDHIDQTRQALPPVPLSLRTANNEALRIALTYHSNALEGSTLTLRDTQAVIEGRSPSSPKDLREIYEARNHHDALLMMGEWVDAGEGAVSEQRVLAIHARLMRDILPRSAGSYRTGRVLIKGTSYIPPGAHHFAELMPQLCALANRHDVHPILRAAEIHYNLAAVHPFDDGNGRTARLLMNFVLQAHGYPITIIQREQRSDYLQALDEANHHRWDRFVNLIADCVFLAVREY